MIRAITWPLILQCRISVIYLTKALKINDGCPGENGDSDVTCPQYSNRYSFPAGGSCLIEEQKQKDKSAT